jgi:phosphonate transport system substrate-binding protein
MFKAADGKSVALARAKPLPAPAIWMVLPMARGRRIRWLSRTARFVALLTGLLAPLAAGHAGWREDMKSFRIGLIAEPGAGQSVTGLAALKQAYAQALGIPVEIFVARDYAALIDAQATARLDYAVYSTTAYATAALLCACVEPVAAPIGEDGATGIKAILVTRDGRVSKPSDIGTHRVAIAELDSIAGFVLPRLELAAGQVALSGSEPFLVHAESASAAETMLVEGSVDAIFGWLPANADAELPGGTLERLEAAGMDKTSLSVVWKSPLLRYGPHALRSGLGAELRLTLVAFLTELKRSQPEIYDLLETHRGGGLAEVRADDYAMAIDMVRSLTREGAER